jgi:dTDP-4-dehydrorhamnose reductase
VILILGGQGQLGTELAKMAEAAEIPVTAVGHAEVDVADPKTIARAVARYRPTLIVNAAAYNNVDRAESQVAAAQRTNALGASVAASAAKRAGIPIIHISTDYVFDGEKTGAYVEDDPIGPLSVYGRTKAAGEEGVRNGHPQHLILRTSWLFGVYGTNFVKNVIRQAAEKDRLGFVAAQRGSPTATEDLAHAILLVAKAIEARAEPWGTYHVSGNGATSRHALATFIVAEQARFTGRTPPVDVIPVPEPPAAARRPINSALDSSKFETMFGYRPREWQEAVERVIADIFVRKKGVS